MIYLQAAKQGGLNSLIPMVLIMGVFFVFMILPQMRKQKKAKAFNSTLKKGNHVVTAGGIHGKISNLTDTDCVIELEDGTKMKIEISSISMELSQARYPADFALATTK